ncbi:hypothetical protein NM688_g162 [Phlebia brevispora]|uniref:Uncharacterized protein n=1 Tax=Phlebia brevispora TaxID=194682 RepID=A0ACC1TET1_9APHY|nr:hypothetical protein NM688_g162 [Phlebia brevispora]
MILFYSAREALAIGSQGCERDVKLRTIDSAETVAVACMSVADSAPSDLYINTTQPGCSVNLFTEDDCPDDSLIHSISTADLAARSWLSLGRAREGVREAHSRSTNSSFFLAICLMALVNLVTDSVPPFNWSIMMKPTTVSLSIMKYSILFAPSFLILLYSVTQTQATQFGCGGVQRVRRIDSANTVSIGCTNVANSGPYDLYIDPTQSDCSVHFFSQEDCQDSSLIHTTPITDLTARSWYNLAIYGLYICSARTTTLLMNRPQISIGFTHEAVLPVQFVTSNQSLGHIMKMVFMRMTNKEGDVIGAMKSSVFFTACIMTLLRFTACVRAAPPGILRFETIASTSSCPGGDDLFTIGFVGTTGAPCTSLDDSAPPDLFLDWTLFDCSVNLFAEAGCPDGSLTFIVPAPASPGVSGCASVETGFRALNVTCM